MHLSIFTNALLLQSMYFILLTRVRHTHTHALLFLQPTEPCIMRHRILVNVAEFCDTTKLMNNKNS